MAFKLSRYNYIRLIELDNIHCILHSPQTMTAHVNSFILKRLLVVVLILTASVRFHCTYADTAKSFSTNDAYVDCEAFNKSLTDGIVALYEAKRTSSMTELLADISTAHCSITLTEPLKETLSPAGLFARFKKSVVMIGSIYKCPKCHDWHSNTSTGFLITKTGVVVTAYHAVYNPDHTAMGAITSDGRTCAVNKILAADKDADVAIIQIDVTGLEPMALAAGTAVGDRVFVISHPGKRPFTLSSGIVSGFFLIKEANDKHGRQRMTISADYGVGSSGGPVIDECGNVAGMVATTQPVMAGCDSNHYAQMIFKDCIPAKSIRVLTTK
ncbi:MAG: serine protease [bacterium]